MGELMSGFPPHPEQQVTLANWRTAPYCRWAFQHVREVVPSADIPNDPDSIWRFESAPIDFTSLQVPTDNGVLGWREALDATETDGLVILYQGKVACEYYANDMTPASPHIIMSVSKSVLGLVISILVDQGKLDPESLVSDIIPEIAETAYRGATARHLLDMRAGIEFDEDYLATSGTIIDYRKATN